jgi:hypothetical protein
VGRKVWETELYIAMMAQREFPVSNNSKAVYTHTSLTSNGVLKNFLKKGDSEVAKLIKCRWLDSKKKPANKKKNILLMNCWFSSNSN